MYDAMWDERRADYTERRNGQDGDGIRRGHHAAVQPERVGPNHVTTTRLVYYIGGSRNL